MIEKLATHPAAQVANCLQFPLVTHASAAEWQAMKRPDGVSFVRVDWALTPEQEKAAIEAIELFSGFRVTQVDRRMGVHPNVIFHIQRCA